MADCHMEKSRRRWLAGSIVGLMVLAGWVSPAADAQPVDDPCSLQVTFLCHFVPMAPDLEGDIDLTQNQPPADPSVPPPEFRKPADYCFNGCF